MGAGHARDSVIVIEVRSSLDGSLTKVKLTAREALSDRPVAVVNSQWRYRQLVTGAFEVTDNARFKGLVLFLQRAGGRVVKHTPELLGAAAFVVTNLSSKSYAREQEIVDDMLRLRLDLSSNRVDPMKRQEFAELFLELLENRWGEAAAIQKRTPWMWMATHHEVGDALIDAWAKLSKDMPPSSFR